MELRRLDQRVEDRSSLAAGIGAGEEPISPAHRDPAERSLSAAIVELDAAVGEEDPERLPLAVKIGERLAHRRLRRVATGMVKAPVAELIEDRHRVLLPTSESGVCVLAGLFGGALNSVERPDDLDGPRSLGLARLEGLHEVAAGVHIAAGSDRQAALAVTERLVALVAVGLEKTRTAGQEAYRVLVSPVGRIVIGDKACVTDVCPETTAAGAALLLLVEDEEAGIVALDHPRPKHSLVDELPQWPQRPGAGLDPASFLKCLHSVGGKLEIARNDYLETTSGIELLSSYTSLEVSRNPQLRESAGLGGVSKIKLLWLYENPLLDSVELGDVESVEYMQIGSCHGSAASAHHFALEALDGLSGLKEVDTLVIEGNESLESLNLLDAMLENDAMSPRAAVIRRNPNLPQQEVIKQLDDLKVEFRDVCGNAGWTGEEDECICLAG